MTTKQIKQEAKGFLRKTNYRLFLLPVILIFITQLIIILESISLMQTGHSSYFPVLFQFITYTFFTSTSLVVLANLRQKHQKIQFSDSLFIFSSGILGPFIRVTLLKKFYLYLWNLPTVIVNTILYSILLRSYLDNALNYQVIISFIIVNLIGLAITSYKRLTYSLTNYLLYEQMATKPPLTSNQLISSSKQLMKKHKWQLFRLHLSFIGWYVLGILTLGLSNAYFVPYLSVSLTIFYEKHIKS